MCKTVENRQHKDNIDTFSALPVCINNDEILQVKYILVKISINYAKSLFLLMRGTSLILKVVS